MRSVLVAVTLTEGLADGWASQMPAQNQLIAASTPQYTALCRLNAAMDYTVFIKTIAAKFNITDDERIRQLVPSLRWMHTPSGFRSDNT